MSSSSSSNSSLGQPISEKLTRENFLLWKAQVVPIVRGARLYGYLDGTVVEKEYLRDDKGAKTANPAYDAWVAQDQQLLGFINSSLSREVLGQVATCATAAEAWETLNSMFASQSRARVIQLRARLASTRKGELSASVYFNKMKGFADEMAAAGKPLEDDDLISYILAGLDQEYNGFIENVSDRTDPVNLGDVYAQFLAAEGRIESQQAQYQSSVNSANRGRGGFRGGRGGRFGGRGDFGGRGGFGRGYGGRGEQAGPA